MSESISSHLTVNVLKEDINAAVATGTDTLSCPVYQALTRMGFKNTHVGYNIALTSDGHFNLSEEASYYTKAKRRDWDLLEPGSFTASRIQEW